MAPEEHLPTASNETDVIEVDVHSPAETRVLGLIRAMVTSLAREMGFDAEGVDKIELAVDEACSNVIRHAYRHLGVSPDLPPERRKAPPPGVQCVLKLRAYVAPDHIRIQIIDHGIGMRNSPPGVSTVHEYISERKGAGGLGNFIIRNFMDEVHYDYPEQGTILTMKKYLVPAAQG
jgi:serine/threonine-protein kinase RsbW